MPAVSGASPVDPTTLLGPTPDTQAKASTAFDKDMFLRLLVAQLRYQNPLKPMDQSEFMAQASQLAAVEQMQAMAKSQAESASWQRSLAAASLVGKSITGLAADGSPVAGVVTRVSIAATGVTLEVGGKSIPMSSITSIAQ